MGGQNMRITRGDIAAIALLLLVLVSCGAASAGNVGDPPPQVQPPTEENTNVTVLMVHRPGVDCIVVMRFNSNAPIMSCNWKVEK